MQSRNLNIFVAGRPRHWPTSRCRAADDGWLHASYKPQTFTSMWPITGWRLCIVAILLLTVSAYIQTQTCATPQTVKGNHVMLLVFVLC